MENSFCGAFPGRRRDLLKDQAALVTDASFGIGEAIVKALEGIRDFNGEF